MSEEHILFEGHEGSEWVRVWMAVDAGGIAIRSHDIGPGVERNFGREDLETILVIGAAELPALFSALREGHGKADVAPGGSVQESAMRLIADRYAGNSAATSMLRLLLDELQIRYDFRRGMRQQPADELAGGDLRMLKNVRGHGTFQFPDNLHRAV